MNYSSAVMLINENIRAVKVVYEDEKENPTQPRVIFKTLDKSIKVDDLVVVPTGTRLKMTVSKVVEIDVDVDFEGGAQLSWIVARVPVEDIETILTEESKWIDALKASEKRKKREEIKASMLAMYKDDGIEKMAIASMSDTSSVDAIEHKQ